MGLKEARGPAALAVIIIIVIIIINIIIIKNTHFFEYFAIFQKCLFWGALGPQIKWGPPGPESQKKKFALNREFFFFGKKINIGAPGPPQLIWGPRGPPTDMGAPGNMSGPVRPGPVRPGPVQHHPHHHFHHHHHSI